MFAVCFFIQNMVLYKSMSVLFFEVILLIFKEFYFEMRIEKK